MPVSHDLNFLSAESGRESDAPAAAFGGTPLDMLDAAPAGTFLPKRVLRKELSTRPAEEPPLLLSQRVEVPNSTPGTEPDSRHISTLLERQNREERLFTQLVGEATQRERYQAKDPGVRHSVDLATPLFSGTDRLEEFFASLAQGRVPERIFSAGSGEEPLLTGSNLSSKAFSPADEEGNPQWISVTVPEVEREAISADGFFDPGSSESSEQGAGKGLYVRRKSRRVKPGQAEAGGGQRPGLFRRGFRLVVVGLVIGVGYLVLTGKGCSPVVFWQ